MWITLVFSENNQIPSDDEFQNGVAGLRHVEYGFLKPLLILGQLLNRKVVLPPPCLALWGEHNNKQQVSIKRNWDDYFDLSSFNMIDKNPPFIFDNKGRPSGYNNKTIKYYDTNVNFNNIRNNIDIIVLSSYTDIKRNLYNYSYIKLPNNNIFNTYPFKNRFNTSPLIKSIVDKILLKYKNIGYTFIHIRRGDFLYNKALAPPNGTITYTSPEYISKFIEKINSSIGPIIIISTNEKDNEYKNNIKCLLPHKTILFEEDLINDTITHEPITHEPITHDNYMIYQIMDEIARNSKVNIITTELKLGNTITYRLADNILNF